MKRVLILLAFVSLAGCSLPSYYRVPVLQGNVVTQDKVQQLELGMTPPQVRYLLGTPLIVSNFQPNRWDYLFYYRNTRGKTRESKLSLEFNDGALASIEGDESYEALLPEEQQQIDQDPDDLEEPPIIDNTGGQQAPPIP